MKKIWWATAPVAAALMIGASSQIYVDLYKPRSSRDVTLIAPGEQGHFSFPLSGTDGATRTADVEVIGFQSLDKVNDIGLEAPENFTPWLVLTQWHAPEDSVLAPCMMSVTGSDGRHYRLFNAIFAPITNREISDILDLGSACTPSDASGPELEVSQHNPQETLVVPGTPRPEKWRKLSPVALPDGVAPVELTIEWTPYYVTLVLPESENFLDNPPPPSGAGASSEEGAASGS